MARTETIARDRVHGFITHADTPIGGVLVLPTITGVDQAMRAVAQELAAAGMTALAWDPFPGTGPAPTEFPALMARANTLNDDLAETNMSACIDHMLATLHLPSAAVIGFCLGGRYSLLIAAKDRRLAACAAFYPSVRVPMKPNETRDAVALAPQIACPVHLVHAGNDEVIVFPTFLKLREALETRKVATMTQLHPGAVHSFRRPDFQKDPANAAATQISWPPALAFLKERLGAAA